MTTTINKEQKNPNVPNLRFPEFEGEWKRHSLTDFMSFKNGMNPDAKRFGTGTKFISVMDILNNQYICYDNIRASVELQDGDIEAYGVNYGDILFQRSSETLEDIGRANVYLDSKPAIFGGFVIRGKSKDNYNPLFFRYLLASPTARKRIIVKGAGAQHFNIGQDALSKVFIDIPTLKEQKKIGKLLQCLDERIATQNKIIEKLQSLIKGLVVAHYSTNPHTIYTKIRDLGEAYSTMAMAKDQLTDKGNPCIFYGELFTIYGCCVGEVKSRTHIKKDLSTLSSGRDLLFPASTTVNALSLIAPSAVMEKDIILGGDMFGIKISQEYNPLYLSYYFNYIANKRLSKYAKGTTIIHLHYNEIVNVTVELPSIEEQNKIVTAIQGYSARLAIEESLLKSTSNLKQYLLSQMFI